MLRPERRVRRREDFTAAVRGGRRAGAAGLVVHVTTLPQSDHSSAGPARAGFIVGRAVGPAVIRNRLRRRLRHLLAPRLTDLAPGTVVIVRASATAARQPSRELAGTLDVLLARALRPDRVASTGLA